MSENCNQFVVTIDGPAGGGKSTAAKNLAQKLNFDYLDTGAMYRTAALAAHRAHVPLSDMPQVALFLEDHHIINKEGRTFLDGIDVSEEIRSPEITALTRFTADNPLVRKQMALLQRRAGEGRRIVTEGRDQGTEVFPDAPCKFYLTASPEVRALRRLEQFRRRGQEASYDEILQSIIKRDEGDTNRQVGPLRKPDDAVVIDSDHMSPEEVVAEMAAHVRSVLDGKPSCEI